jgi:hypothetical protein
LDNSHRGCFEVTTEFVKNKAILKINNIVHIIIKEIDRIYTVVSYFDSNLFYIDIYNVGIEKPIKLIYNTSKKWQIILDEINKLVE